MKSIKATLEKKVFSNIFRGSIAGRIAISVSILILVLFGILLYFVQLRSQEAFENIIRKSQTEGTIIISDDSIFPCNSRPCPTKEIKFIPAVPVRRTLRDQYREQLEKTLLWVAVIGVVGAVGIGVIISRLVTSPLAKVQKGMSELRKNNYKTQLDDIGIQELDELTTEFNRLGSELEKVEQLRKDLISDTTHELKTPVTSLIVQLEAIKDGIVEPTKERIVSTVDQAYRLKELIDKLLEYTLLRSKATTPSLSSINIKQSIEELRKTLTISSSLHIELDTSLDTTILADRSLFIQCATNIIRNTDIHAHATQLFISFNDGSLRFSDNGKGVSKEKLPYIFERFYRIDESRSRKTGGIGLGLAIVKEIVEAHGWKITAQSKNGLSVIIRGIEKSSS